VNSGNIFQALEPVIQAFDALGIGYHIAGSVASSAYGIARATLDVDLVANLNESQIKSLVDRLSNGYYIDEDRVRDAVARRSSFNLIHLESMLKVDVFVLKSRPYDQVAFARARLENLGEGTVTRQHYLASPEDVILNKLEWYREGGCLSERQWNDVVGILKVQQSSLDIEYMRCWAATLDLTDLLLRALADAGMNHVAGPVGDA
jgi:hypothetical protein